MKKKLSIINYLVFLGLGVALVWWQLSKMSVAEKTEFKDAIAQANYFIIVPVALFNTIAHFFRSLRWRLLISTLGHQPHWLNTFASTLIGNSVNSILPRVGEVLKCTLLARKEHYPVDKIIGTVLVERTIDVVTFFLFVLATVLMQSSSFYDFLKAQFSHYDLKAALAKLPLLLLVFAMVVAAITLLFKYTKKHPKNKLVHSITHLLEGIGKGFATVKHLQSFKAFLFYTLLIWIFYVAQIYIGFKAMDGLENLGVREACAVLTFASVAMMVTPGGLGSFPLLVMKVLALFGIANTLGNAFGFLMWGISTFIVLLTGLVSWACFPYLPHSKIIRADGKAQ